MDVGFKEAVSSTVSPKHCNLFLFGYLSSDKASTTPFGNAFQILPAQVSERLFTLLSIIFTLYPQFLTIKAISLIGLSLLHLYPSYHYQNLSQSSLFQADQHQLLHSIYIIEVLDPGIISVNLFCNPSIC